MFCAEYITSQGCTINVTPRLPAGLKAESSRSHHRNLIFHRVQQHSPLSFRFFTAAKLIGARVPTHDATHCRDVFRVCVYTSGIEREAEDLRRRHSYSCFHPHIRNISSFFYYLPALFFFFSFKAINSKRELTALLAGKPHRLSHSFPVRCLARGDFFFFFLLFRGFYVRRAF